MKRLTIDVIRMIVLWVVLMVGQALGGLLFFRHAPSFPGDGPLNAGQALLLVSLIDAVILTLLADALRLRGWRLGLVLASALFGIQTFQSVIETIIFNADVRMPATLLAAVTAAAFVRDLLAGGAIALLWRGAGEAGDRLRGLTWKAPVIAAFYVICYFTAGSLIAWRSAAVRAYYAHVGQIDVAGLVGLQFVRGLIWCGLAWLLVRWLSGPAWRGALLVGVAFSGFVIPGLLFPNPVMPWPVRAVHMVEVGTSNFLFGVAAALLLRWGAGLRDRTSEGVEA